VDTGHINAMCRTPTVKSRVSALEKTFAGRKILLGFDRLDYIKGMPHKLLGFELFLARHPEWRARQTSSRLGFQRARAWTSIRSWGSK